MRGLQDLKFRRQTRAFVQASPLRAACLIGLRTTSPWGAARPHGSVNYEKYQFFLNQIARGITNTRFHEMEGSQPMIDVWRKAGLASSSTYVGLGQLRYLNCAELACNELN